MTMRYHNTVDVHWVKTCRSHVGEKDAAVASRVEEHRLLGCRDTEA
ncbi:MAG TPA: hypothetical protein VM848_03665 [Acidimicrobiia bacterium]|nr:hypothetical protein [Acidimicrobiia bacterium]